MDGNIAQDIENKDGVILHEDNHVRKMKELEFEESTITIEKEEKRDWNDLINEKMEIRRKEAIEKNKIVVNTKRLGKKSGLKVVKGNNKFKKSSSRFGKDTIKQG